MSRKDHTGHAKLDLLQRSVPDGEVDRHARVGPAAATAFGAESVIAATLLTGMITDVSANTFAWLTLDLPALAIALPLQTAFLGFVMPFLWSPESVSAQSNTAV